MTDEVKIDPFQFEPFVFLEGGRGLNDCESKVSKQLFNEGFDVWVLDDLYSNPDKLVAIKFLKPKTIFIGTTGVYKKDLSHLKEVFKVCEYIPDNLVLTVSNTENHISDLIEIAKATNPKFRVFELYPMFNEDDEIKFIHIKDI